MYRQGDLVEDFTEGSTYAREIFDPDGNFICHVIETKRYDNGPTDAEVLLSHLNRS